MSICESATAFEPLQLPATLDDVEGLVHADLKAIVAMIATQAHERLFLTRREFGELEQQLWNRLVGAIHEVVEPLSPESR